MKDIAPKIIPSRIKWLPKLELKHKNVYSPVSAKRDNARNFNRDAVSAFLLLFSVGKVQPGRVATYE